LPTTPILISTFYSEANIFENKDITEKLVFAKLVKEYSNDLNVNQLQISNMNSTKGEFYITPKPNSTVYANSTLTAQINVSNSAVLTYSTTILTSGTNSGKPTFTYRGTVIGYSDVTYSIVSAVSSPISFDATQYSGKGTLTYASGIEFAGGIYVITGKYTDPATNVQYSAS
jgi:hypothetical protein